MKRIDTEVALSLIVAVLVMSFAGCASLRKLSGLQREDHCPVAVITVRKTATQNFNQGGAS